MTKFDIGNIVVATNGREKGECFVIAKLENNYAYLVNGKSRTLTNMKKKNIKHLCFGIKNVGFDIHKSQNCDIIYAIKKYSSSKKSLEETKQCLIKKM